MKLVFLIILFIYACYIGYRIAQRLTQAKDPNSKPGCVTAGYVIVVYLAMCFLSFPFIGICISSIYGAVANPEYDAIVTSVRSYESDNSDDNGTTTMHTPTVKFTTAAGEVIERELNISSGNPYIVGEPHAVSYEDDTGQLVSKSLSSILLLIGGLLFAFAILGYVIIGFAYAYDIPIGITGIKYTVGLFLYVIAPIGMVGYECRLDLLHIHATFHRL